MISSAGTQLDLATKNDFKKKWQKLTEISSKKLELNFLFNAPPTMVRYQVPRSDEVWKMLEFLRHF